MTDWQHFTDGLSMAIFGQVVLTLYRDGDGWGYSVDTPGWTVRGRADSQDDAQGRALAQLGPHPLPAYPSP